MKLLIILVLGSCVGCAHGSFGQRFWKGWNEEQARQDAQPAPVYQSSQPVSCTSSYLGFGNYATNCN